jgi:hypothetical protein
VRQEVTTRAIGTQKSDAERATEKFSLLQLPPYETIQALCELLGDELDCRNALNRLEFEKDILSYSKFLITSPREI